MLKLQPNPTFKTKVAISVAGDDAAPQITIEFKYLNRDALKEYFAAARGKPDAEALAELVVGWEGVEAPYSADNLAALLNNYPAASFDIFDAFNREITQAKRKN